MYLGVFVEAAVEGHDGVGCAVPLVRVLPRILLVPPAVLEVPDAPGRTSKEAAALKFKLLARKPNRTRGTFSNILPVSKSTSHGPFQPFFCKRRHSALPWTSTIPTLPSPLVPAQALDEHYPYSSLPLVPVQALDEHYPYPPPAPGQAQAPASYLPSARHPSHSRSSWFCSPFA
jgi:hypothetical protein